MKINPKHKKKSLPSLKQHVDLILEPKQWSNSPAMPLIGLKSTPRPNVLTMFYLNGTNFNYSSTYHPQTNGQSEVVNKTLEMYLRCFTSLQPKDWVKWFT